MAVKITRTSVMGFIEETSEGELKDLSSGNQFVPLREGFSFDGAVETLDSDELVAGDIGMTKSFVSKEAPTASFPKYYKHSGVEGQAPEHSVLIKSAMGSQVVAGAEYSAAAGSVAGDSSVRASISMGSDQEDNFAIGQALLIKDGTNGYSIRNVHKVDSAGNKLDLNFNLANAPAVGVALGKSISFKGSTTHPTFSAHRFQATGSDSAFKNAMAGCRTTSMGFEFPAIGFAECAFEFAGIKFFYNQVRVSAGNKFIDFTDDVGDRLATLSEGVYRTPHDLAKEVASKMTAASVGSGNDTYTCVYDDITGKFSLKSDGTTFSLKWKTGTKGADNTNTHAGDILGYADTADDTGATLYVSDNKQSYGPGHNGADVSAPIVPSYDSSDNLVLKGAQLLIGDKHEISCRKATSASFSISTPKTDVPSLCAENGIDSSAILSREATFSATLLLQPEEVGLFDKFVNNTTTQLMFNAGVKSAGNWAAGKCINLWMANASITAYPIADSDGYQVVNIEAKAFVSGDRSDVYINFI